MTESQPVDSPTPETPRPLRAATDAIERALIDYGMAGGNTDLTDLAAQFVTLALAASGFVVVRVEGDHPLTHGATLTQCAWVGPYGVIPGEMDNEPHPRWVPVFRQVRP